MFELPEKTQLLVYISGNLYTIFKVGEVTKGAKGYMQILEEKHTVLEGHLPKVKNPHKSQILTLTQDIRSSKFLLILKGSFLPPTNQKVTGIYQPKVFF